jgi:hypothetical protein
MPAPKTAVFTAARVAPDSPGIRSPLVRLAPQGSWSLRSRDDQADMLPPPEAQNGTILHLLCIGAGRARG